MICFLTKDLMMSSNASSHARQHKVKFETVGSADKAIETIQEKKPHMLIVDLQTPGLDVDDLGEKIKGLADAVCPLTIAYCQHVEVQLIEKAKSAGFDQVFTRGQMNAKIGDIIANRL